MRAERLLLPSCCEFDVTRSNLRFSLVAPPKNRLTLKVESRALQRLAAGPCNVVSAPMLMAGAEIGLGINVHVIHIISLAATMFAHDIVSRLDHVGRLQRTPTHNMESTLLCEQGQQRAIASLASNIVGPISRHRIAQVLADVLKASRAHTGLAAGAIRVMFHTETDERDRLQVGVRSSTRLFTALQPVPTPSDTDFKCLEACRRSGASSRNLARLVDTIFVAVVNIASLSWALLMPSNTLIGMTGAVLDFSMIVCRGVFA